MNKKEVKKEEFDYQIVLIKNDSRLDNKPTGHLSLLERDKITVLFGQKYSIRQIAKILKRTPSTIYRLSYCDGG